MKRKRIHCEEEEEEEEEQEEFRARRTNHRNTKRLSPSDDEEDEDHNDDEEDDDDDEKASRTWRTSPRKTKPLRYTYDEEGEDSDDEDSDDDDEDEDEDEDEDKLNTMARKPGKPLEETGRLRVTCGSRTGIMDVGKLSRGEPCIKCGPRFWTPPAFEDLGGRGSAKKWKSTIFYDNKPLQFFFEQGSLTTRGYNRRRAAASSELSDSENSSENCSAPRAKQQTHLVPVSNEDAETEEDEAADEGSEEVREEDEAAEDKSKQEGSKVTSSAPEKVLLPNERPRVILERLPEVETQHQISSSELQESGEKDEQRVDEDEQRVDGDEQRVDGDEQRVDEDNPSGASLRLNVTLIGDDDDDEDEQLTQNRDREEPQREPAPSAAAASSPVVMETERDLHIHTDVSSSDLQPETSVLRAAQSSDEAPPSCSDATDLLRLKKEKIQLQLRVLKLQQEYYSLKIKELKN